MDKKYSFVINNSQNDLYVLVANCWIIDEYGNRVDIKAQTFVNLSLQQCFDEQYNFIV